MQVGGSPPIEPRVRGGGRIFPPIVACPRAETCGCTETRILPESLLIFRRDRHCFFAGRAGPCLGTQPFRLHALFLLAIPILRD